MRVSEWVCVCECVCVCVCVICSYTLGKVISWHIYMYIKTQRELTWSYLLHSRMHIFCMHISTHVDVRIRVIYVYKVRIRVIYVYKVLTHIHVIIQVMSKSQVGGIDKKLVVEASRPKQVYRRDRDRQRQRHTRTHTHTRARIHTHTHTRSHTHTHTHTLFLSHAHTHTHTHTQVDW